MQQRPVPVLINRSGGTAKADPKIAAKVRAAFRKAEVDAKVELLDGPKCAERCKALAKRGAPLVVVGGGDGTISAAAGALAGTKTALGVLPLGTLNHFARDLGIGFALDDAVGVIAKGRKQRVDLAEVNGRIFINNSAIGLYPLMVVDREAQQKRLGRSKKLALLVASLRTLARFRHQQLGLSANGEKEVIDTPLLFVGNNDYRVDIGAAGERQSLSDGRLCVLVLAKKTRLGFFGAGLRALFNRTRSDDMVEMSGVQNLKVSSRRSSIHVAVDGEVDVMKTPLDYKIHPKALSVLAP
jgi:YegS/Rv2252/BmrU family lipid kinase